MEIGGCGQVTGGCGQVTGGGGQVTHIGRRRRLLRDQVLLTLFALDILGLGAGHVHVGGEGLVVQQVVEGVQVVRLVAAAVAGRRRQREGGRREWRKGERGSFD